MYILASRKNGTLYTGVTSNLKKRIWEHKNNVVDGFTKKYSIHTLVYYEPCPFIYQAIAREKQIKGGSRKMKLAPIEERNPQWRDLYGEIESEIQS